MRITAGEAFAMSFELRVKSLIIKIPRLKGFNVIAYAFRNKWKDIRVVQPWGKATHFLFPKYQAVMI